MFCACELIFSLVFYSVIAVREFGIGSIIQTEHLTNVYQYKPIETNANDRPIGFSAS